MSRFSLTHLSDAHLRRDLAALVSRDRTTTAELLAHLAELDRRRLYRKLRFESLYEYCVQELKLSEDCAKKRIRAARTARQYPGIFAALADGRLSLTAVLMLSRHLTRPNARELLTSAERKSNAEIEALLAARFPQPDWPTVLVPMVAVPAGGAPARSDPASGWSAACSAAEGAARPPHAAQAMMPQAIPEDSPAPVTAAASSTQVSAALVAGLLPPPEVPPARVMVLAPDHVGLQVVVSQATREKLQRAADLLAHAVPSGDLAQVLDRALDALLAKLERRKFGATDRPRATKPTRSSDPRYIPRDLRRAVAKRDGRQCTYVGSGGQRCESRRRLEYDHIVPVAHGGQATLANLRLRCRAHNQLEAEQVFGAQHMQARREQSARARPTSPPAA